MTMGQLSACLRRAANGHAHWCPGCEQMHLIPDGWTFDGNAERPSFSPSVKITYNGSDAGQLRDGSDRAPAACCHYILTAGQLNFCGDCTHPLSGKVVPLPALPHGFTDP